jgi:hypothetical protein
VKQQSHMFTAVVANTSRPPLEGSIMTPNMAVWKLILPTHIATLCFKCFTSPCHCEKSPFRISKPIAKRRIVCAANLAFYSACWKMPMVKTARLPTFYVHFALFHRVGFKLRSVNDNTRSLTLFSLALCSWCAWLIRARAT